MKLKELITNSDGRLSTTSTIQMMASVGLTVGFLLSIWLDKSISGEIAYALCALAGWTGTSKGIVGYKRDKEIKHTQGGDDV